MADITLRKALSDYIAIYMAYRNFAQRTRVEYQNDLEDLGRYLEKSGINHVKEIGLPIIERYVASLEQKGFASLTRKRKVVAIRSFLSFLYQDGHLTTDIAKKIILPFTESSMPHILTQRECDQLRNACANSGRDSAIIELLLQTGIKLSEITNLALNDVELEELQVTGEKHSGFIRILGDRGKKERIIPLNSKASAALKNYLGMRKNAVFSILFLNRFAKPLGDRGVQKMLRKYMKRAGIGTASIHTLRHTFGVHHALNGASIKNLKEVMGHRDLRSTEIYFSLTKEMRKEMQNNGL
jgi:integrase/recombinase XerD